MGDFRKKTPDWAAAQPQLRDWYAGPLGSAVLDTVETKLEDILPEIFGYQGLQVGQISPGKNLLASAGLYRRVVVDSESDVDNVQISGELEHLPISSNCVNLVFYPHSLEFCENPHGALREADRVLTADGHLLILGINPYSMFGIARAVGGLRNSVPWCGRTYSRSRLTDWLSVLGFRTIKVETVFLRPPVARRRILKGARHIERAQPVAGFVGGIYLIHARKVSTTLTRVRPQWRTGRGRLITGAFAQRGAVANRARDEKPQR